MSDDKRVIERVSEVAKSSVGEHLVNVLKAALSTAPFAGGIASLMNDYIPSGRQSRLEEFAENLGKELSALQNYVKEETILTDEFAYLFEQCFRGAADNYQNVKLDAFRNILLNAAIRSGGNSQEQEYFLSLVSSLSTLHIRILHFMASPERYLEGYGISPNNIRGGFSEFFPVAIPDANLDMIKAAFGDLHQAGFINTDKSMFGTMTSGQGLQLLNGRVLPLGVRFIQFCTKPNV